MATQRSAYPLRKSVRGKGNLGVQPICATEPLGVDVLHLLFAGHLCGAVRVEGDGLAALRVDPVEVKALVCDLLTGLSSQKAFEILRVPSEAGWALVDRGVLPVRIIQSAHGAHVIPRFDPEAVAHVAANLISPSRSLELFGMGAEQFSRRMRHARIRPAFSHAEIGADLYHRADTHRILGM